jgi:nucleoside-diphosphate-sugar epimerase
LPKGSPTRRLPDISKMRALGFDPIISLQGALSETVDWYANQRAAA